MTNCQNTTALRRQAVASRWVGHYAEAIRLLEAARRLAPDDPETARTLAETQAAAGLAESDWRRVSGAWTARARGLVVGVGCEPGLPGPMVRVTIGGGRLIARFSGRWGTSPSDHPVIVALRLLRPAAFWRAIDEAVDQPVTVLVDPTDCDGPGRTLPHIAGSSRCALALPVPDFDFVGHHGYAAEIRRMASVPWEDRQRVALWRGAPTGEVPASGSAEDLLRVRLCRLTPASGGRIDAGLHRLVDLDRFPAGTAAALAPLVREAVPAPEYPRWRYQIYIDGHSNAWSGMLLRLVTGSPVLKVESATGWRQWYYDRLVPWRMVVPVASDLSDLTDKIDWLRRHDDEARAIGAAAKAFATSLDVATELRGGVQTVLAAARALQAAEA